MKVFALRDAVDQDSLDIDVMDIIGRGFLFKGVTAHDVVQALKATKAKSIRVRVNSVGGDVSEANAIAAALRERAASGSKVSIAILGLAASAATIIANAGDDVAIARGAFFMMHNSSVHLAGRGTAQEHEKASALCRAIDENLVAMYAEGSTRRGKDKSAEQFRSAMNSERYFSAQEAVAWGLVDIITEDVRVAACADLSALTGAPSELIEIYERVKAEATAAPKQETPPALDAGEKATPIEEKKDMSDKPNEPLNLISVARALGLPAGSTEQDILTRCVQLVEQDVQLRTLSKEQNTAACMGATRAAFEAAEKLKSVQAELSNVKLERDQQNFEALLADAETDRGLGKKFKPAEAQYQRELFAKACAEGRGETFVADLRGYLAVKSHDPRMSRDIRQPGVTSTPLAWNGKSYGDLKPLQRSRLANENPELFRLMKEDHEAGASA